MEWEALAAAAEVESGPRGSWDASGRPIILFERPSFFTRDWAAALTPRIRMFQIITPAAYPRTKDGRWDRLREAFALDAMRRWRRRHWRFQILGLNYNNAGAADVFTFVANMAHSERGQLAALVGYIRGNGLVDALQRRDWVRFANGYNGPGEAANQYDQKMAAAYARLKANPMP